MRITLADTNAARGQRIWERLSRLPVARLNKRCYGLTDAFDSIEHNPPEIVIYSEDLMRRPEFSTMESLCKCLSVRWMALGNAVSARRFGVQVLDPNMPDDLLIATLLDCMKSDPLPGGAAAAGLFRSPKKTVYSKVVLIGSSTGGIDALLNVLGTFPIDCPPTVIVQHTGAGFGAGLARVLNQRVEARVREVRHGDILRPGNILLASGIEAHLRLEGAAPMNCRLDKEARISGHSPSVDALFSSAVPNAKNVTAALLTGMGRDGADGLLALRKAGAKTISQDEATSVVYGMPRAAAELGASEQVLPLSSIGPALLRASQMKVCN